jgi:hypothetical protein
VTYHCQPALFHSNAGLSFMFTVFCYRRFVCCVSFLGEFCMCFVPFVCFSMSTFPSTLKNNNHFFRCFQFILHSFHFFLPDFAFVQLPSSYNFPSTCLLSTLIPAFLSVCHSVYLSFLLQFFSIACLSFYLSFVLLVFPCLSFLLLVFHSSSIFFCLSFLLHSFVLAVFPSGCISFCLPWLAPAPVFPYAWDIFVLVLKRTLLFPIENGNISVVTFINRLRYNIYVYYLTQH